MRNLVVVGAKAALGREGFEFPEGQAANERHAVDRAVRALPQVHRLDQRAFRLDHLVAGRIVADNADQQRLAAQCFDIVRSVGRSAQCDFILFVLQNQYGRFPADPLRLPIDKLIRDNVAHHGNAMPFKLHEQGQQFIGQGPSPVKSSPQLRRDARR